MDWTNERYVRLYTRTTADLLAIGWEGRLVWYELLRHADRAGVIDTGGDLDVMPELVRVPTEIFAIGIERCRRRDLIRVTPEAIVIPNFMEAQEAHQSAAQRQRESRAKRRAKAMRNGLDVTDRDHITSRVVTVGHALPDPGDVMSLQPSLAVPSPAVPSVPSHTARVGARDMGEESDGDRFIALWSGLFTTTYKSKPTWGIKQLMLADLLLCNHGLEAVAERARRLFESPPHWLKPPFTIETLSSNWDRLVKVADDDREGRIEPKPASEWDPDEKPF